MLKMWAGRTAGQTDKIADDFNSSIFFDCRMYRQDITGSMAHAAMLGAKGIIPQTDADILIDALAGILSDMETGSLQPDMDCEDIHMFVEQVLTERVGEVGTHELSMDGTSAGTTGFAVVVGAPDLFVGAEDVGIAVVPRIKIVLA